MNAAQELTTEQPPTDLIALAIEHKADVDTLERLFALRERDDAAVARRAFFTAMQAVQTEAPRVVKDSKNTQTGSAYAKLESIAKAIRPVYTAHGFSLSYGTEDSPREGYVRITCDVMHVGGHMVPRHVDMPLDDVGIKGNVNKTPTHAHGSTISYGRRYLVLMAFDIVMAGEDDDGNAADDVIGKHDRLIRSIAVAREWLPSILCIKENICDRGDVTAAAEAYAEMPWPVLCALNVAPSKGGLYTTEERKFLGPDGNKEFHDAVHQIRTDAGWYQREENKQ